MAAVLTCDTSVLVPAISSWHESHRAASAAIAPVRRLAGHVVIETMSTLSRLPRGLATPAATTLTLLESRFDVEPLTLDPAATRLLFATISRERLVGGQMYDALVAATALAHGAILLSMDRRAEPTYRAVGVSYDLVTDADLDR